MNECRFCLKGVVGSKLDLGDQPISNRFLSAPPKSEYKFHFQAGICDACGLMQLIDPPPVAEIVPRFSWIQYNEPEDHLDSLCESLAVLPGLNMNSPILGLTSKDDTLLERFRKKGFASVHRIDPKEDLEISNPMAGIETIPSQLNIKRAEKLKMKYGEPQIFIARHVFEHAQEPAVFLNSLKFILGRGYLLLEVPDCSKAVLKNDYTTLWEEHAIYFTPQSFPGHFSQFGGAPVFSKIYEQPFENSLVAVFRFGEKRGIESVGTFVDDYLNFMKAFPFRKKQIHGQMRKLRERYGPVAILGAGHLTAAFINFFDLRDFFSCVIDDFSPKQGLFLPGCGLPIMPSSKLVDSPLSACLIGVGVGSEEKIYARNKPFLDKGGLFFSIFPEKRNSVYEVQ